MSQLQPFWEKKDLVTIVHALVTSRLNYCNMRYVRLPLEMSWKLQLVQNALVHVLTGASRFHHIIPILQELYWLPIAFYAQFKVLVFNYKALYGLGQGYKKDCFFPYYPTYALRSAEKAVSGVLPVSEAWPAVIRRTFSIMAPLLWNSIRRDAHLATSAMTFRHMKADLFMWAFNWM